MKNIKNDLILLIILASIILFLAFCVNIIETIYIGIKNECNYDEKNAISQQMSSETRTASSQVNEKSIDNTIIEKPVFVTTNSTITKKQLVGIWKAEKEDSGDIWQLEFNEESEMIYIKGKSYAKEWYGYTINKSEIELKTMDIKEYAKDIDGKDISLCSLVSSEYYMPESITVDSDGRLKYKKDNTIVYFKKISDSTDLNSKTEIKKKCQEILDIKNTTREFAKKYFKDNSIKAEEISYTEKEIPFIDKCKNQWCKYKIGNNDYIYIVNIRYCNEVRYGKYKCIMTDDSSTSTKAYKCKIIDEYAIVDLKEEYKFIRNSNTKQVITDFEYLFMLKSNNEKAKTCKYEDIVTIYLLDWNNDMPMTYLIDLKGKKMYYGVGPYNPSEINDYKSQINLSNEKTKKIINTIKNVNIHNWEDHYKGENIGTGSFNWNMIIEYKNGIIEFHSGDGMGSAPKGYYDIEKTLRDIKKD